jgi:hypothetical protein
MQEGWFCNPILYYDGLEKWGKKYSTGYKHFIKE